MVEIAKAVSYHSKVIVFDEPTSSLTEEEVEHLFRIINMLRDRGMGIIYISHKMAEIKRISDEITVMRDGQLVATRPASELEMNDIIRLMVGRELGNQFPPKTNKPGEVYLEDTDLSQVNWASRAVKYRDVEYEVAALVTVPHALSYRYYGADEFVMNDQTFIRDTGTDGVMYYAFDTTDQDNAAMEAFLADYTENVNPQFDYESKATYAAEFESFRSMFLLLGGVLSLIVGLVGVLNFFNAILTGIITRKREFAVLQSIGMTGRQLKTTLVYEGLLYALGAVAAALVLTVGLSPLLGKALGSMFWFLTYRFTAVPILLVAPAFALLGVLVPLGVYRSAARRTVVERLREAEQGG